MIHVRLTADDLRNHHACLEGVERFDEILPDGIDCEWTDLHGWMALATFGADYRWAAAVGLVPDLTRANFAGAYLAGACLEGAYVGRSRPVWLPDQWDVRDGFVCRREA